MRATVSMGRTLLKSQCDRFDDLVARGVTMGVVDLLEVINVEHQQQSRLAITRHPVNFAVDGSFELTTVGQPGQSIAT